MSTTPANLSDSKQEPAEKIKSIVRGQKDPFGNTITNVIDCANEFAIYEIEASNINERLRLIIDGYNKQSEQELLNKFNAVSQKYIEAKGLLYRSANFGMMKHRVANLLGNVLSSSEIDGNSKFDELIAEIKKENDAAIQNRMWYLLPAALTSFCFVAQGLYSMEQQQIGTPLWQIKTALIAASLGGSMSILLNISKLNFEEYARGFYILLGAERLFLAVIAGAIAFVLIKAGLFLPDIGKKSYWGMMAILVVAAFSESIIPRVLEKIENKPSGGNLNQTRD